MKKLLLSIFAVLGVVLFYNNNANAMSEWYYITNVQGIRGYTTQTGSNYKYYGNQTWLEGWTLPSVILGSAGNNDRIYLNGVAYSIPNINIGNNQKKYNILEIILRFEQGTNGGYKQTFNTGIQAWLSYTLSDGTSGEVPCKVGASDNLAQEWNCSIATTNYTKIVDLGFDWGAWKTIGSNPTTYYIAGIGFPSNPNSISLATWRYRYESTDDPLIEGQNTIINQNNTIINQNNQINQNIEDIHDAITDSNISGNFNLQPVQPFGPIGQITNAILGLPLILVGVGTCNDVVAPLPYINEDLTIPCPHKWLPQISGQLLNTIDVIMSAGIYFTLARYIFKKVQNLRDPENDDEEYLDI